jgi:acyl-CoA thioesterase FadM
VVLLFRFVGALIAGHFQPRIGPLDEAVVRMRVWPNDLDLNLHASSGRYISFMDAARVAMLVRFGAFRKVIGRGWRPIVGGTIITYRRSLFLFERMTIRSRVVCWDEKWLYMEHLIEKANGELAAKARVRVLFRARDGNVLPRELARVAGHEVESPPLPDWVRHWAAADPL